MYPTWHPPVDPETGCSFGHEHGRDPHGSKLYRLVGDIPLGLANEALETYDAANPRREDHDCVQRFLVNNTGSSSDFGTGLHESWQTSNNITTADGHSLASFDPYFQVSFPSRYYDPAQAGIVGRPIDLCFLAAARARGGACQESIQNGAVAGTAYDDPRSAFNGVERFVDINSIRIDNREGPTVWYTDPFGHHGRTSPFPGSVRQVLSKVNNSGLRISGPGVGFDRFYGGARTHAPN